ncbi:hypothetical protein EVAR_83337_1 [Eumeta japonica]|uniref:Uncharacterized protein n=1 Tax=Eumeta variegata TaxID=151549 RepID=A0A4C1VUK3_EUMVA|nr:hypothetical protein EVAR_83337_1 [Eumeta japonica]
MAIVDFVCTPSTVNGQATRASLGESAWPPPGGVCVDAESVAGGRPTSPIPKARPEKPPSGYEVHGVSMRNRLRYRFHAMKRKLSEDNAFFTTNLS